MIFLRPDHVLGYVSKTKHISVQFGSFWNMWSSSQEYGLFFVCRLPLVGRDPTHHTDENTGLPKVTILPDGVSGFKTV